MLVMNPRSVSFDGETLEDVTAVAIDRRGERVVVEWSDEGPHAVFADVPERRVVVCVTQEVARGDITGPAPGDEGELVLHTSPTSGHAARRRVSATVVITSVGHELSRKRGALRTIECVAISGDGTTDPIEITPAEGGSS